jgi:hypothetical protein
MFGSWVLQEKQALPFGDGFKFAVLQFWQTSALEQLRQLATLQLMHWPVEVSWKFVAHVPQTDPAQVRQFGMVQLVKFPAVWFPVCKIRLLAKISLTSSLDEQDPARVNLKPWLQVWHYLSWLQVAQFSGQRF